MYYYIILIMKCRQYCHANQKERKYPSYLPLWNLWMWWVVMTTGRSMVFSVIAPSRSPSSLSSSISLSFNFCLQCWTTIRHFSAISMRSFHIVFRNQSHCYNLLSFISLKYFRYAVCRMCCSIVLVLDLLYFENMSKYF